MAVSIGPRIGIDGEKKYRDEINRIIQQAKTLDSEMKAVTSAFDKNTSAEEKSTAMTKNLNSQLDTQKQRVEALQKMVEQSANATGENSTQTLKWKEALANAQTAVNQTENRLANLDEEIKNSGKSMDEGKEKAKTFGDMLKASLAAKAIEAGVKALASAVKELGSALASCVTDSAAFADSILTLSTNTGLSTDTLQEYQYMAELTDTSLDTITSSMVKLANQMDNAKDGQRKSVKLFKELGISVTDANKELRPTEEVFQEVIDALGQIENPAERDALAMDIFGRSAQDLNSFIAQGSDGIEAFAKEAHDMGYVLDKDALTALGGVDDAMQRMKNTGTTLKNQIGLALAPTITELADGLMSFASQIDWNGGLAGIIDGILAALPGALSMLLESASSLIEYLTPIIPEIITKMNEVIIENAPMLVAGATQMLIALASGLIQNLPQLLAAIPQIVKAVLNGFATGLAPMLEQGKEAIASMWDGISSSASMIWGNIKTFVNTNIIDPVKEKISEMVSVGTRLVEGLWEGIISSLSWIKGKITSWVGDVLTFIKNLFGIASPSKVTAGYGKFLVMGLAEGIDDNIGLATRAWSNVSDAVGFNMGAGQMVTYQGATVNIYPQNMDNATVDYLFDKFNARMGALA